MDPSMKTLVELLSHAQSTAHTYFTGAVKSDVVLPIMVRWACLLQFFGAETSEIEVTSREPVFCTGSPRCLLRSDGWLGGGVDGLLCCRPPGRKGRRVSAGRPQGPLAAGGSPRCPLRRSCWFPRGVTTPRETSSYVVRQRALKLADVGWVGALERT